jgi:polysaccharide export outer membrane protein
MIWIAANKSDSREEVAMKIPQTFASWVQFSASVLAALFVTACAKDLPSLPPSTYEVEAPLYIIGPGDNVNVHVWGNPDLSAGAEVRPDGRITTPLIEDVQASGNTPTQLSRLMEKKLQKYLRNPVVTVTVGNFVGRFSEQVRIVGEATEPRSIPYREHMTVLDVVIAVGGLTEFAAGNNTTLVRLVEGQQKQYRVRLDDLIEDGDISANVDMFPGDVLIIPEAFF